MPKTDSKKVSEKIDILTKSKVAPLINRSIKPGARELRYIIGRHDGKLFLKIMSIRFTRSEDGDGNEPPPIGTWVKQWIPFEIFVPALNEWHEEELIKAATFLLPTVRTRLPHPFPGVLRLNSTVRGHLVAMLRKENILEAFPRVSNLEKEHPGHYRAGYKSAAGRVNVEAFERTYLGIKSKAQEPFTLDGDVYPAMYDSLLQHRKNQELSRE